MKNFKGNEKYETEFSLNQYLLFHYGAEKDLLPFPFGPKESLHFPVRCVSESLADVEIFNRRNALDIGCAVGRSSFELSKFADKVLAIDSSQTFINAAKELQDRGSREYYLYGEGRKKELRTAEIPEGIDPKSVIFQCLAAENLFSEAAAYDIVLAANLICRLERPKTFLQNIHRLVSKGGLFILTSPYSWLPEFTSPDDWIGEEPLLWMKKIFHPHFTEEKVFNLPFLLREHSRKYEWGVSQVSVWRKI